MTAITRFGAAPKGPGDRPMPFSRAVLAGDFVFVSGQVPLGDDSEVVPGGIIEHTHQTMKNLIGALASAGAALKDVVKCTVWLEDARDFASFNKVYLSYFGEHPPARSCVESRLMINARVEIEAIAYVAKALP
jgi:reactive intermediate/imine deaminase